MMLRLVRNLFQDTPFFRKIHFSVLQRYCCGLMQLQMLHAGRKLFNQGDRGEDFFIVIEGKVNVLIRETHVPPSQAKQKFIRTLGAGDRCVCPPISNPFPLNSTSIYRVFGLILLGSFCEQQLR